jgi:hypothetical protein
MIAYDKKTDYTLVSNGNYSGYTLACAESYSCFEITIDKRVIFKRETLKNKHYKPNIFTEIRALILILTFNIIHGDEKKISWYGSKKLYLRSNTGLFPLFVKLYFLTLIIRGI